MRTFILRKMLGTKFKKVFFPKQSSKILGIGMQETIGKCLSKFGLLLQMVTSLRGERIYMQVVPLRSFAYYNRMEQRKNIFIVI